MRSIEEMRTDGRVVWVWRVRRTEWTNQPGATVDSSLERGDTREGRPGWFDTPEEALADLHRFHPEPAS